MKILYVEDHETLFTILQHHHKRLDITWADTLEKANQILSTQKFDAILLDLNLPDSKGLETVSAMVNRGMPVIVLTGDPSKGLEKDTVALGAADHVFKKSFLDIDLEARIRDAVDKHRKTKSRYSSFTFGDIEKMKRFISCPPFANSERGRRAVMA